VLMSGKEIDLLRYFLRQAGEALSRERILNAVWGHQYEGTERTVDNFIQKLREKLEVDPASPRHFQTVRGVGYRFVKE
jgi:DNA-binding response OmpR family regulator